MRTVLFVVAGLLGAISTFAAEAPVRWSISLSKAEPKVGDEIELVVTAQIAPAWIVYGSDFTAELGPQPTQIVLVPGESFRPLGPVVAVNAKQGRDKTWETNYTYFSARAEFRQKIKVLAVPIAVEANLKGQLCNERDGTCTLFKETLKL